MYVYNTMQSFKVYNNLSFHFIVVVLESLGPSAGGEYGSLGVSWKGQSLSSCFPSAHEDDAQDLFRLPWQLEEGSGSETALTQILTGGGMLHTVHCMHTLAVIYNIHRDRW